MARRLYWQFATVLAVIGLLFQSAPALAHYTYLGSGYWPSSSVTYKVYATGSYAAPAAGALDDWSQLTELTLTATAPGYEKIAALTYSGTTLGPYGYAKICTTAACWATSFNATYTYAEIVVNVDLTLSSWNSYKIRYVYAHEAGHALSLDDLNDTTHLMHGGCCAVYDTNGIFQATFHEQDAINLRY